METQNVPMDKTVAICMTIYNRDGIYQVSLNNLFEQTYRNMKFFVVDDCSTDGGRDRLYHLHQDFGDIFGFWSTQHRNYIDAMNLALKKVKMDKSVEYVCWLDSDDYIKEDKIMAQVAYLNDNPDVDVVACLTSFGKTQILAPSMQRMNHDDIKKLITQNNGMNTVCHFQSCMFRRSVLDMFTNDKFFYDEYIGGRAGEGFLYTLFVKGCKFASINNTAYVYNIGKQENSLTNTIIPDFANNLNALPWKERKIEITKLFKKYNTAKKKEVEKVEEVVTTTPAPVIEEVTTTPAPKKRGRPKKVVEEVPVTEAPKKRGRPKKVVEETTTTAAPKKRGRPKKNN